MSRGEPLAASASIDRATEKGEPSSHHDRRRAAQRSRRREDLPVELEGGRVQLVRDVRERGPAEGRHGTAVRRAADRRGPRAERARNRDLRVNRPLSQIRAADRTPPMLLPTLFITTCSSSSPLISP